MIYLRRAEPADAMAVARVHVRSWQAAYRGILPDEYLDGLRPEDRATSYTFGGLEHDHPMTIVSVGHEMICGFATIGLSRDASTEGIGALHALYVDPDSWDTGVGRTLIHEARQQLAGQGFEEAALWVLAGNERAERFYRKDGWAADGSRRSDEVWSVAIDEVRYRRTLPRARSHSIRSPESSFQADFGPTKGEPRVREGRLEGRVNPTTTW